MDTSERTSVGSLLAWAIPSWIFFIGGWPVGLAIWLIGVVRAFRRGRGEGPWLLALGPLTCVPALSLAFGVAGYASGRAVLMTNGLPGPGFSNLDRETRAHWVTGGCVTDGAEFFWQAPNNVAIRKLVAIFGTVPHAYDGPYPTREEAAEAPPEKFERSFEKNVRPALGPEVWPTDELRFASFDKRCLVVHVHRDGRPYVTVLLDRGPLKVFARYYARGR